MNKFNEFINNSKQYLSKHSPEILTGIGITGMVTSTVLAVKATPKALVLIEEERLTRDNEALKPIDILKVTWKEYIPSALVGISSIVCIIYSTSINNKRNAALTTAYAISRRSLETYRDKVIETIGEKKEKEIRDKVAQDNMNKENIDKNTIVLTSKGNALFKDEFSGRYFKGDLEAIRKSINDLNRKMFSENYISLNEYYTSIGLEPIKDGYQLGWNIERGYIDIDISACLTKDEEACICLSFTRMPETAF